MLVTHVVKRSLNVTETGSKHGYLVATHSEVQHYQSLLKS